MSDEAGNVKSEDFVAHLKAVLLKRNEKELRLFLDGEHPLDIAEAIKGLKHPEVLSVFEALDDARAMEVLDRADADTTRLLAENAPTQRIEMFLKEMPNRKTARTLAQSAPKDAASLLADLKTQDPQDMKEIRQLLSYKENTAGRMTTQKYVRLAKSMTMSEAFQALRDGEANAETTSDLFVTEPLGVGQDGKERLIGVVSMREMMRARLHARLRPKIRVADIMTRNPVMVSVDTDQNEVATTMSKHHFLAIPVIGKDGAMAGVIQADDVIDVLGEEYLRTLGGDSAEIDRCTPVQLARLRVPWLLGTMGIELCAGLVIAHFNYVLTQVILLASFMPVISAISGNVGLQAAAITVRGLDTGHASIKTWWKSLAKELVTSAIMALVCGVVLGVIGAFWSKHLFFGLVIGAAMAASMLTAAGMGTVIPMVSKKLKFDPATTAGPFETAFQDIVGFGVFLWLASLLLHWLK